ncbi:MAG: hypothetical protein H6Q33_48 [Deltaproteobacteria bacterium]|nr:hypothetical protein [Deltaproteobacteria bacterium]
MSCTVAISAAHRSYLFREQVIAPALMNCALNGIIAWLIFRARSSIPVWGDGGLVFDTIATLFLLPFLTCLIVTPLIRRGVAGGKVPPLTWRAAEHGVLGYLPLSVWGRGAVIGGLAVGAGLPIIFGGLSLAGVAHLAPMNVVVLKGVYTAMLAGLVGPVIALCAISDASPAPVVAS